GDRLADPPRGVGGELEALAPVELLDGVHEPEVALLDEVEERKARRLVLLGDRDDQSQVGLDERALGLLALARRAAQLALASGGEVLVALQLATGGVAGLDGLRQANLVVLGQQRVLADVGEVQPDEIFLVALDALLGQRNVLLASDSVRAEPRVTPGTETAPGADTVDSVPQVTSGQP